jgi:hypothetical protein
MPHLLWDISYPNNFRPIQEVRHASSYREIFESDQGVYYLFDRIVFEGRILPLVHAKGAMSFCRSDRILNKVCKEWMTEQSRVLIEAVDQPAAEGDSGESGFPLRSEGEVFCLKLEAMILPQWPQSRGEFRGTFY